MTERIHLSKADISPLEEQFVLDAMRSGWIAPLGPDVDAFEQEVAERVGAHHALALSSGTAALHLALLEAGAGPGKTVVLPTMTFAASANAIIYTGASPAFVDSQSDDGNVDPKLLLEAVDHLLHEGSDVAAVMSVDLFGRTADYGAIEGLLQDRNIVLIEDAAEGLGATYEGRPAGTFGKASVLSFNGNKIMTTSGGGMLLSDDEAFVEHARKLSTQAREPFPWYEHQEIGYNYRLSNILAALGRAQLRRLDTMISSRRGIRDRYIATLSDIDGLRFLGTADPTRKDNCWLTTLTIDAELRPVQTVIDGLHHRDIESRHLWKPLHLQAAYAGRRAFINGTAESLFAEGIALPSGSYLTDTDIDRVIDAVRDALT